jgi:hypothetical protein
VKMRSEEAMRPKSLRALWWWWRRIKLVIRTLRNWSLYFFTQAALCPAVVTSWTLQRHAHVALIGDARYTCRILVRKPFATPTSRRNDNIQTDVTRAGSEDGRNTELPRARVQ